MKNIHILPTDKPSRLVKQKYDSIDRLCLADMATKRAEYKKFNIHITSDEEIKEGDWFISLYSNSIQRELKLDWTLNKDAYKKIILTTDQDLIKDGVQEIDDEFLEWFVKNPTCEGVKTQLKLPWESSKDEYEIIIPKEEPKQSTKDRILSETPESVKQKVREVANALVNKQETLEEAKERYLDSPTTDENGNIQYNFKASAKEEPKQETTLEDKLKLLVEEWQERQINYETSANNFIENHSNNRKFTYKAMATRDCWKELLKLIKDGK